MEIWIVTIIAAVVSAVLGAVVTYFLPWIKTALFGDGRVIVRYSYKPGGADLKRRELGYWQAVIRITVVNEGDSPVQIEEARLMLSKKSGFPVPVKAPVPRTHPLFPAVLQPGLSDTWYFGVDELAMKIVTLYPRFANATCQLRPMVKTVAGKKYFGEKFDFSTGPDTSWLA